MKKLIKFHNTLLILAVTIFFQSCTKTVDLIVHNGNIYTVDENFSKASAFAVKNDNAHQ